jgi:hypothetical protein
MRIMYRIAGVESNRNVQGLARLQHRGSDLGFQVRFGSERRIETDIRLVFVRDFEHCNLRIELLFVFVLFSSLK